MQAGSVLKLQDTTCKPATARSCCYIKRGGSRLTPSPHDGDGERHMRSRFKFSELPNWETWLEENGITVEERRTWELGGYSVYFRVQTGIL